MQPVILDRIRFLSATAICAGPLAIVLGPGTFTVFIIAIIINIIISFFFISLLLVMFCMENRNEGRNFVCSNEARSHLVVSGLMPAWCYLMWTILLFNCLCRWYCLGCLTKFMHWGISRLPLKYWQRRKTGLRYMISRHWKITRYVSLTSM